MDLSTKLLAWLEAAHEDQDRQTKQRRVVLDQLRHQLRQDLSETWEQLKEDRSEQRKELRKRWTMQRALERILNEQNVAQRQLRLARWSMLVSAGATITAIAALVVSLWRR